MTQANTARRDGDAFQARQFWWRAARLLDDASPIVRVGFEAGPKSFDDIWVQYDDARGPCDQFGRPLLREHVQCKWHVSPGTYTYLDLADPAFVNANARSLLQRAHRAQLDFAPDGDGARFKLLSNWRVDNSDPLREIIGRRSGALRTDRLFEGKTEKSQAGALRRHWRDHLSIDDQALNRLAGTLAFGEATDSLDELRDQLDVLFSAVGMRRIPANESAFPYDDLVFQWLAQGRIEFDRASFRQACAREGLLEQAGGRRAVFGVKSFEHAVDRLEDRCEAVLDLVPEFDDRFIRSEGDWADKLYPALKAFLLDASKHGERLRLALDAHVTLAFAAGSVLNLKSGRIVELEQRSPARRVWSAEDVPSDPQWPAPTYECIELDTSRPDLAVAVALTHDVTSDVRKYVEKALPHVGRILVLRPRGGADARVVASGRHAFELAVSMGAKVKSLRAADTSVHVFMAVPNAFAFFAGQQQPSLGRTTLYEFDFEGGRDGSYRPSLTLPTGSTLR